LLPPTSGSEDGGSKVLRNVGVLTASAHGVSPQDHDLRKVKCRKQDTDGTVGCTSDLFALYTSASE